MTYPDLAHSDRVCSIRSWWIILSHPGEPVLEVGCCGVGLQCEPGRVPHFSWWMELSPADICFLFQVSQDKRLPFAAACLSPTVYPALTRL